MREGISTSRDGNSDTAPMDRQVIGPTTPRPCTAAEDPVVSRFTALSSAIAGYRGEKDGRTEASLTELAGQTNRAWGAGINQDGEASRLNQTELLARIDNDIACWGDGLR